MSISRIKSSKQLWSSSKNDSGVRDWCELWSIQRANVLQVELKMFSFKSQKIKFQEAKVQEVEFDNIFIWFLQVQISKKLDENSFYRR
ncbi:unnamed protein product, partial [Nesidiocoris tenuis]